MSQDSMIEKNRDKNISAAVISWAY